MPLSEPSLDTRTFDQLVADSRSTIPRLASPWTDHNASDPGITLVELLAWLVEQDLFRLDRLTEQQKRAFLALLDRTPRPDAVAETVVAFEWTGAGAAPVLPAGLQLASANPSAAATFETVRRVVISPATLAGVWVGSAGGLVGPTVPWTGELWPALGPDPAPGAALYLGFDQALGPADAPVRLAMLGADPAADALTWAALVDEWCASAREGACCGPGQAATLRAHPDATIVWEYHRADGTWAALPRLQDSTRALSLTGWVCFRVPSDHAPGGPVPGWCVRARLTRGGYGAAPVLRSVHLNAAPAAHAVLVDPPEDGGVSQGHAEESFDLAQPRVVAGSAVVRWTDPVAGVTTWREVHDWLGSGPHDPDALVDLDRGRVTFGNGLAGRVPPAGARLAVGYRTGSGPAGNIEPGVLTTAPPNWHNLAHVPALATHVSDLLIDHVTAGFGGREAESVDDATAAVISRLEFPDKAVTVADFERLALATPGIDLAQARAVPAFDQQLPCVPAAGLVTVIVVPRHGGATPSPTDGERRAVACYLERRRLVTTEVHVMAPCYDRISVSGTLVADPGIDPAALELAAGAAVDGYLHPLTGGRDGRGYPIGRPVYLVEVMTLLAALPGVQAVTGLALACNDGASGCSSVELCPQCLPAPGEHHLAVTARQAVRAPDRRTADDCR